MKIDNMHGPDGLEEAAVTKHYRDTGTQLRVLEVDGDARTIVLGNYPGARVTYRWTERSNGGFRLVVFEGGEV